MALGLADLAEYGSLLGTSAVGATMVPLGAEPLLAALIAADRVAPVPAVLVATIGNMAGASVNYALGRTGRAVLGSHPAVARAEAWLGRFGAASLVLSFLPVVGDPLTVLAGAARIRLLPFLGWTLLGRLVRFAAVAALAAAYPGGPAG